MVYISGHWCHLTAISRYDHNNGTFTLTSTHYIHVQSWSSVTLSHKDFNTCIAGFLEPVSTKTATNRTHLSSAYGQLVLVTPTRSDFVCGSP